MEASSRANSSGSLLETLRQALSDNRRKYVTLTQFAKLIGKDYHTVFGHVQSGRLKATPHDGGGTLKKPRWRVYEEAARAYLEQEGYTQFERGKPTV